MGPPPDMKECGRGDRCRGAKSYPVDTQFFPITPTNPELEGATVLGCKTCFDHYKGVPGSRIRKIRVPKVRADGNGSANGRRVAPYNVDQANVRKQIAQAQRGEDVLVQAVRKPSGVVVAVPGSQRVQQRHGHVQNGMIPPPPPAQGFHLSNDRVLTGGMGQGMGYTTNHTVYESQRHEAMRRTMIDSGGHFVSVKVELCRIIPSYKKPSMICWEVIGNVSAHIGAPELSETALRAVRPGWDEHAKFDGTSYPLTLADVFLRSKDGVKLEAPHDAIAAQFFKLRAGRAQTVFKSGQAVVWLQVKEEHYHAFERWRSEAEENKLRRDFEVPKFYEHDDSFHSDEESLEAAPMEAAPMEAAPMKLAPKEPALKGPPAAPQKLAPEASEARRESIRLKGGQSKVTTGIEESAGQRARENGDKSVQRRAEHGVLVDGRSGDTKLESAPRRSAQASSLGRAAERTHPPASADSLNKNAVAKLASMVSQHTKPKKKGGESIRGLFKTTKIPVTARCMRRFNELEATVATIATWQAAEMSAYLQPAEVFVDLLLRPGETHGQFKRAQFGISAPSLFSHSGHGAPVCVKQMTYKDPNGKLQPFDGRTQLHEIIPEIWSLGWGGLLHQDVNNFIQKRLLTLAPPKEFEIPTMHFVEAALATNQVFPFGVYLVEEFIDPEAEGPFVKYINNDQAIPLDKEDLEEALRAEFLSFCQHVQYWRTNKLMFVSDYQGGRTLLTDPQIVTHPALGDVFAAGNIPESYCGFEDEHSCNRFCEYFDIPRNYDEWELQHEFGDPRKFLAAEKEQEGGEE